MKKVNSRQQSITNGSGMGLIVPKRPISNHHEASSSRIKDVSEAGYVISKPWVNMGLPIGPTSTQGYVMKKIFGDDMSPVISPSSIVFLKEVDWQNHVEYGRIHYIVATDGRAYLRYIKPYWENQGDYFELHAANLHYDEFEMPKSHIQSIWAYHGHVSLAH